MRVCPDLSDSSFTISFFFSFLEAWGWLWRQNEWSPCSFFRARPPFPFVVWTGSFLVDQYFLFLSTRVWYNSYFLISSSHLSPLTLWFPKINWWYFLLPLSWKTPIFALLFVCFRANKTSLLASIKVWYTTTRGIRFCEPWEKLGSNCIPNVKVYDLTVNRIWTRPRVLLATGPNGKCHRTAEIKKSFC